jgi:hypothetical protein
MQSSEQQEKLKALAVETAQKFPGLPFLIVMGTTEGGTLTMGNTGTEDQIRVLRMVLESFEANAARVTHKGPV